MRAAINIDRHSDTPVHRQVYEAWRDGILRGRFGANVRVPSTRELADSLSISRSTVTQAYEQLIAEGYLYSFAAPGREGFCLGSRRYKRVHAPQTSGQADCV